MTTGLGLGERNCGGRGLGLRAPPAPIPAKASRGALEGGAVGGCDALGRAAVVEFALDRLETTDPARERVRSPGNA